MPKETPGKCQEKLIQSSTWTRRLAKETLASGQVDSLSEKCLNLEGRSNRQNLRVAGFKEGEENGKKPREFVAQLLKEALNFEDAPVIDRAHRALQK